MVGRAGRVVAPTVATGVVASLTMVVVNFATEFKTNPWWWLGVVVATGLVAAAALWLDHRSAARPGSPEDAGGQVVNRSRIEGDNVQIGRARDVNLGRRRDPKK